MGTNLIKHSDLIKFIEEGKVEMTKPKSLNENVYYSKIKLKDTGDLVYFQTPTFHLENSENITDDPYQFKYEEDSTSDFTDFVNKIDDKFLTYIKTNKENLFSKAIDDSFLESGQIHSLQINDSQVLLEVRNMKDTQFYNYEKKLIEKQNINEEFRGIKKVKSILCLYGVWFTKINWGLTLKLVQIKPVSVSKKSVTKYMFPEEVTEDTDEEANSIIPSKFKHSITPGLF